VPCRNRNGVFSQPCGTMTSADVAERHAGARAGDQGADRNRRGGPTDYGSGWQQGIGIIGDRFGVSAEPGGCHQPGGARRPDRGLARVHADAAGTGWRDC
jgi:hypothetical protein